MFVDGAVVLGSALLSVLLAHLVLRLDLTASHLLAGLAAARFCLLRGVATRFLVVG